MKLTRSLVLVVQLAGLLIFAPSASYAEEPAQDGQALDQAANDPTASLMSVQIQDIYAGNYHNLNDESGNTILLRSAVPFQTGSLNHIARATLPIVTDSPSGKSGLSTAFYKYTNILMLLFIKFLDMISLQEADHAKKKSIYHLAVCR